MRVEAVEVRTVRLPMVVPLRSAGAHHRVRDTLLVRVVTDAGEGWGECPALPEPTYTGEFTEGAREVLRAHLAPRLLGRDVTSAAVGGLLARVVGHPMAASSLEMALLDAELRASRVCLAEHLGAVRTRVDCGVVVGMAETLTALLDEVAAVVSQGYRRVKLKIAPGWDVEPVRAVRAMVGGDVVVQVDANGSYRPGDLDALRALEPFGLALIEQPYPADALLAHAELARATSTPVCLDESVTSARVAADAIALGACSVVCVKAARVGGYLEAVRVHDVCRAAGVAVWCGGMLESGLGRAANLALAALPGFTLAGDLSESSRWFERDITEPVLMVDGRMAVPTAAGIGAEVLIDAVEELTVHRESLTA